MKYIFIVQGEGRGHLTQAITLSSWLREAGHEVASVLVGRSSGRSLPNFFHSKIGAPVHTFESPDFCFTRNLKRVAMSRTLFYNFSLKKLRAISQSMSLISEHIYNYQPDVIINFYELIAPLVKMRFLISVPMISIAHQFVIEHPESRHGKGNSLGEFFLRLANETCALGAAKTLALSFYPLEPFPGKRLTVVPPLIRDEVLLQRPSQGKYILGYMVNPGYEEEVRLWHAAHPETALHLFWDKPGVDEHLRVDDTLSFHRINDSLFLEMMAGCSGYITTAGFESVCEALFLGKPTLMIPTHIEQQINAADAADVGAGIINDRFDISKLLNYIPHHTSDASSSFRTWISSGKEVFLHELTHF